MIYKIRELLFRFFKKDGFIGKLIDKFVTKEFISYVFFGVLTTILNFAVYVGFHEMFRAIEWEGLLHGVLPDNEFIRQLFEGEDPCYLDANTIAWVAGVIFAFVTNKLWVFESKSWKPSTATKEFIGFTSARIFSFVIETLMMFVLVTLMHSNTVIAKIIIGVVVIILNYIFSKLFIFKKKA